MEFITVENFMDMEMYIHETRNSNTEEDKVGRSPLCQACLDFDETAVSSLLKSGADVNSSGKDGKTPLHLVCEEASSETPSSFAILQLLLTNGADINAKDKYHQTPLILACENDNLEYARVLLSEGCKPDVITPSGNSAMKIACKNANYWFSSHCHKNISDSMIVPAVHIAKCLLGKFSSLSMEATCLPAAVQFSHHDIVKDLLECGMSVNQPDDNGRTALGCACMVESVEPDIVELLLRFGADVNRGGSWGKQKPLKFAFAHNSLEKIKLLLSYGAQITSEEMTELVSMNLSRSILENPEVINFYSKDLRSWRFLLAAGFTPTFHGAPGTVNDLLMKLRQMQKCSSYNQIVPWIKSLLFPLRSLKSWCRISIRRHLKFSINDNIEKLEIPHKLKEYLLFSEVT